MESRIGVSEVELFVQKADGKTLLFVHGFPLSHAMWRFQMEAFGQKYRAIAPDLRGLGNSDVPKPYTCYSMEAYAADLKNLLDRLGIDKAVFIGLSMGGYIAFAFHRLFPERLKALVLADTRAAADSPEGIEARMKGIESVKAKGLSALADGMIPKLFASTTLEKNPELIQEVRSMMERQNPTGVMGALWAMAHRPDSSPDLPNINVPTLVMVGEEDTLTPPDMAKKMADSIPGARLTVIPGAGHMSPMEAPEAFNEALMDFLSELP